MKLELTQDLAIGRLNVVMAENCHGDSHPLVDTIQFNRFHEKITADTAALAGAMIAARWCGDMLELQGLKVSGDVAESIRMIAPDVRFIQPIDGYRRHLCEGRIDLLVAPAAKAASVLLPNSDDCGLTRLLTWSGEFVDGEGRNSAGYVAGEIATTANLLLSEWEVSVCLGLLVGGLSLRSITVPQIDRKDAHDFERIADALRIMGVQLRAAAPAERMRNAAGERRSVVDLPRERKLRAKVGSAA